MKPIKLYFFISFGILASQNLTAQSYSSAGEYMNAMHDNTDQITNDVWDYMKAISHSKNARKTEKRREELKGTILKSKKKVSAMSGYEGDLAYKKSVVEYLDIYYKVMNEDYAKIVDMEAIAEESYDNMEAYMLAQERAGDKSEEAYDKLKAAQQTFADNNDVTLLESTSKRGEKIKIAGEVHDYYNKVYLVFFKSYKQEMYLIDAVSKSDVSAIEQNKNALISTVDEGEEKLKEIKSYKGDLTIVTALRNLHKFYKDEATNKMDVVVDFFLKKENFEKVSASFNAIKSSKRTQADIDKYNAAVNEYNESTNVYNTTNEALNGERGKGLDGWNKSVSKFLDKYVPRGR